MRIGVIGAGAVGGTLAALLDRAGHDGRGHGARRPPRGDPGRRAPARRRLGRAHGARCTRARRSAGEPELVILATKAQDAAAALEANRAALAQRPAARRAERTRRPRGSRARSLPVRAAARRARADRDLVPRARRRHGHRRRCRSIIGAAPDTDAAHARARRRGAAAGACPIEVTDDIVGAQWTKLLINHVNALPAITGLSRAGGRRRPRPAPRHDREHARDRAARASARGAVRHGAGRLGPRARRCSASCRCRSGETFPRLLARRMGDGAESGIDAAEHPARSADRDRLPQRRGRRARRPRTGSRRRSTRRSSSSCTRSSARRRSSPPPRSWSASRSDAPRTRRGTGRSRLSAKIRRRVVGVGVVDDRRRRVARAGVPLVELLRARVAQRELGARLDALAGEQALGAHRGIRVQPDREVPDARAAPGG